MAVAITYNSYLIPMVTEFSETVSYRRYQMSCTFVVTGAPGGTFNGIVTTAEASLKVDSQRLQVAVGGASFRDFNPSDYSGMKARTEIRKDGSTIDTEGSRKLKFSIEIELPADSASDAYRQEASWGVRYEPNNKIEVSFRGIYTGGNSVTARANYNAGIATWIAATFTALSLTESVYELIDTNEEENDEQSTLTFSRTYKEVLFNQSSATLNLGAIKNPTSSFNRSYLTEGGRPDMGATYVDISYACTVDSNDGTYGSAAGMQTLWDDVIKPHLIAQAKAIWGGSASIIESSNAGIDPYNFTLQSNMKLIISTQSDIIAYQESLDYTRESNRNYHKILDGKNDTYNWHEPGKTLKATQTVNVSTLSGLPVTPDIISDIGLELLVDSVNKGFFNLDSDNVRLTEMNRGLGPDTSDIRTGYDTVITRNYTYLAPASSRVVSGLGLRSFVRKA